MKNETKSLMVFLLGYFSAILVMWIAQELSDYLSAFESSGTIVSGNGDTSETGERVTSLVKEYVPNE